MNSWELCGAVTLHCPGQPVQTLLFPSQLLSCLSPRLNPAASPDVLQRLAEELDNSFINYTLSMAFHMGWTEHLKVQSGSVRSNSTLLLGQWATLAWGLRAVASLFLPGETPRAGVDKNPVKVPLPAGWISGILLVNVLVQSAKNDATTLLCAVCRQCAPRPRVVDRCHLRRKCCNARDFRPVLGAFV